MHRQPACCTCATIRVDSKTRIHAYCHGCRCTQQTASMTYPELPDCLQMPMSCLHTLFNCDHYTQHSSISVDQCTCARKDVVQYGMLEPPPDRQYCPSTQDVRKAVLVALPACETMVAELVARCRDVNEEVIILSLLYNLCLCVCMPVHVWHIHTCECAQVCVICVCMCVLPYACLLVR